MSRFVEPENSITREKSERECELEDLLSSARAIAQRKGVDTAWERFDNRLKAAGIGWVTAKTFRVLPSDLEEVA